MAGLQGAHARAGLKNTQGVFYLTAAAATTLEPFQQNVIIDSTGAFTLSMPSVEEAIGKWYSITLDDDGGSVTVEWSVGGATDGNPADSVMTADADFVLAYCDGFRYRLVDSTLT